MNQKDIVIQGWKYSGEGDQYHYIDGLLHNDIGPAVIYYNGDKLWYKNGFLHREDEPAIEFANGKKAWFYNSQELTFINSNEELLSWIKCKVFW